MRSTDATQTLLDALRPALGANLPAPWGVGYSAGRDSAVLLWGLTQIVSPLRLRALHVDHGMRSESERAAEAAVARDWCARMGVDLLSFAAPVVPVRGEAGARAHRYACFRSFLESHPHSPVFLAHHADDQAETVLMRLLRGRSWQGLSGMAPVRGPFRRPLLGLRASLLAQVALEQGIPSHEDSSNSDSAFARNLLRRRVFPIVIERFPRAVEALNDFSRIWAEVAPPSTVDPAWRFGAEGGWVDEAVWDRWPEPVRQAQLLAAATQIAGDVRLGRRFLERLTASGRSSEGQGGGWRWSRRSGVIQWGPVVQRACKEYFVHAEAGRLYELGSYRMRWTFHQPPGDGVLFVPGVDPEASLVWRSASPGMQFASADDPAWGKAKRRRRLGALEPDRCALLIQGGLLRAAVDPRRNRVLWSETGPGKLNKTGIFVKLRGRSDYERR